MRRLGSTGATRAKFGAVAAAGVLVGALLMTAGTGHPATDAATVAGAAGEFTLNDGFSMAAHCNGTQLTFTTSDATDGNVVCGDTTTTTTVPVTTTTVPSTTTSVPASTTTTVPATTTTIPSGGLPPGVTLQPVDGGPGYFGQWTNGFPASPSFYPIGVFPFETSPASLAAIGVNYGTPMRNDNQGTWAPVYNCGSACVNDQTHVNAQAGFYSGGDYEGAGSPAWGDRAAFNVFGDELDGQCSNGLFGNNPSNVTTAASKCGSWGGTTAAGLEAANAATASNDPSRPVYDQFTDTFTGLTQDGSYGSQYTTAQQEAVCASTDILSFDLYPLVKRGEPVYDMYNDVAQMRSMCGDNVPVFPFVEMDHMDGGNIYPQPAQTEAEVWNAIIAGAGGVQYFDQYGDITSSSYTGGGHYAAGAMYQAIKATDAEIVSLAPVINSPFADGYVTATGSMSVMAKDDNGSFTVFAAPHAAGSQTVTFTVAGGGTGPVTVVGENRTVPMTNGSFTDTFANVNAVHIYSIG